MAPMFFDTADEGAYPFDPSLDSGNAVTSTQDTAVTPTDKQSFAKQTSSASASRHRRSDSQQRRKEMAKKRRGIHRIPLQKVSTTEAMIWKSIEWGDGSPCYEPANAEGGEALKRLMPPLLFSSTRTGSPHLRKVRRRRLQSGRSTYEQIRYIQKRHFRGRKGHLLGFQPQLLRLLFQREAGPDRFGLCQQLQRLQVRFGRTLPRYFVESGTSFPPRV